MKPLFIPAWPETDDDTDDERDEYDYEFDPDDVDDLREELPIRVPRANGGSVTYDRAVNEYDDDDF